METLIVYCHPSDEKKENKLLGEIQHELKALGHKVTVYNIVGDVFSPNLIDSAQVELPDDEDVVKTIEKIQQKIIKSQQIIFLFPKYWDDITIYLRRFINKVFFSPYKGKETFATNKKLRNLKAVIITGMRLPQILFSSKIRGDFSHTFTISILKLCGIRNIKWFNMGGGDRSIRAKEKKLQKVREYFKTI